MANSMSQDVGIPEAIPESGDQTQIASSLHSLPDLNSITRRLWIVRVGALFQICGAITAAVALFTQSSVAVWLAVLFTATGATIAWHLFGKELERENATRALVVSGLKAA